MDDDSFQLKRWEMGIAGSILVLSQALSHYQLSSNLTTELDKVKEILQQSEVDRETYFVRKRDLRTITFKLDQLNERVISLKAFIKTTYGYDAQLEYQDQEDVSCHNDQPPKKKNLI